MYKNLGKKICMKAIVNKKNNQINFSLKRNDLPKETKKLLPNLKGIKFDIKDMEFK